VSGEILNPEFIVTLFSIAEVPLAKPRLAPDETIINPYYMKQLLEYGIKLGQQAQSGEIDQGYLAKEAEASSTYRVSRMQRLISIPQRLVAELKALES